jgi:A/G-specific adenine glycosylase
MKGYLIELNDKTIDGIWCTKKEIEETYAIPTAYKVYKKAWLEW